MRFQICHFFCARFLNEQMHDMSVTDDDDDTPVPDPDGDSVHIFLK